MTLDDLEEPLHTLCFKKHASFGAHHENLNEDRRMLSATKLCSPMTLDSAWQYKAYADIYRSSQERGRQATVG